MVQLDDEKRHFHRYPEGLILDLKVRDRLLKAVLKDVSFGGACVESGTKLPVGEPVELLFPVGSGRTITRRGKIVWESNGAAGCQYLS